MGEIVKFNLNKNALPAFVLDGSTPERVGRAMIENGFQKQPFIIFDMDEAFRRIQHLRDLMPRVRLFYPLETNNTKMFLKFAISQRIGFSCSSPGELKKLRKLNVNPRRIIYAMPTKTPEQMSYARDSGVMHTTFDSLYELEKLSEHWPDAQLLIRIRIKNDSTAFRDKFGCDFTSEAFNLLEEAAILGLKVVGVAYHVGSACNSSESYVTGLKYAKALFDHEDRAGRTMKILDIGAGFYCYETDNINQISKAINACLEELFPDPGVQVIAEPGRYLGDSAFTLYCNIINVRTVTKDEKSTDMVYLSEGIYGSLRYYEKWHIVKKFKRTTEQVMGELRKTILWGPTCDSEDQIMKKNPVFLPKCTQFDWLIFQNVGVNTITLSTKFSCPDIPLIRPVVSKKLWNMIKDRDVFSLDDFIVYRDISSPLPVSLPPLPPQNHILEHSHTPKLKV